MISQEVAKKIKPGATVRVWEKVSAEGEAATKGKGKGGDKAHISKFEGLVLARKHGSEAGASFTVRSTVAAVGVEKVYPLHSPVIEKVEVLSTPKKVLRAKLYYVRTISKKEIRQKLAGEQEKTVTVAEQKKETKPATTPKAQSPEKPAEHKAETKTAEK